MLSLAWNGHRVRAIYKPRDGEAPLWDFPDGTLYRREMAAYLLSEALGWQIVPPTVIRNGPLGVGAVQWFVNVPQRYDYRSLVSAHENGFKKIATFDCLANNADRKVGHCLVDDGHVWGIDHGLTFHSEPKLRTVIWDFAGQPIPNALVDDLKALRNRFNTTDPLVRSLIRLLDRDEVQALYSRLSGLVQNAKFPIWSGSHRAVPWPPF